MSAFRTFLQRVFGKRAPSRGAEENDDSRCPSFNDWSQADHIIVETTSPNDSSYWRVELQASPQSDARIDIESRNPTKAEKGTILVVGKGMATKDLTVVQGYEIDTVDGPVLQTQLVIALLLRAFPSGPAEVRGEDRVDIEDKESPIELTVGPGGHAFAIYQAPWSLRGLVRRKHAGVVEYELTFTAVTRSMNSGKASHLVCQLAGVVQKRPNPFELPDSFPLQDWRVFRLGPSVEKRCLAYAARPVEARCCTVAELREATQPWTSEELQKIMTELMSRRQGN
jgi:hypothetical protein